MLRASVELRRVYLPVVIVAGTFGNVVVVVIQRRLPASQKSSMSVYFTALAVSDTTALWTAWFWVLQTFGIGLHTDYHSDVAGYVPGALCKMIVWTTYSFGQTSAWVLVSMTVHRALSIVWPHRTKGLLTKSNARKVVVFVYAFCTLSNAHILYGHSLERPGKEEEEEEEGGGQRAECFFSFVSESYGAFFGQVWVWEDIVVAVVLPFAFLLVTNSVLIRRVRQSVRETRETLAEGRRGSAADPFASRDKKLSSMTVTLVAMSAAFLSLTLPINVYMILARTLSLDTARQVGVRAAGELASSAVWLLWYSNLAVNFYLYCLTGARYRAHFLALFGRVGGSGSAA